MRLAACLAVPLALASCAAPSGPAPQNTAGGDCVMHEEATLPVLNDHGSPIVEVGINGKAADFVIDTGAFTTSVSPETVTQYALPIEYEHYMLVGGVGGQTRAYPVTIDHLTLGGLRAGRVAMWQLDSFGHQAKVDGLPLAGLFGADFLVSYDVEFDLPAHRITLYLERGCDGDVPQPWDGVAYRVPFTREGENKIALDAKIDGRPVQFMLDSGAGHTIVNTLEAGLAGTGAADRRDIAHGVDRADLALKLHHFASLDIGPEHLAGPWIEVGPIQTANLLGVSYFRSHRIWVSYPNNVLWVQPVATPAAHS